MHTVKSQNKNFIFLFYYRNNCYKIRIIESRTFYSCLNCKNITNGNHVKNSIDFEYYSASHHRQE